jgi:hypothetical protein
MDEPSNEKSPEEKPAKEKYETPRLWRYGTLSEMTKAATLSGAHKDNPIGVLKT